MILNQIHLSNFRNFSKASFKLDPLLTIVIGDNAQGKTNLLESIYCLAYGAGFRESKEEELIKIKEKETLIEGDFSLDEGKKTLLILLRENHGQIEKKFFINKTKKAFSSFQQETIKAILFSPSQIEIITGSPDERREYFDKLISSYELEYRKKIIFYETALRKRNKILEIHHDEEKLKEELAFWNNYLEEQAVYITKKRQEYVDFLNKNQKIDSQEFYINYEKNPLTKKRLADYFYQEKKYRKTLIGPQKDDFIIFEKGNFDKDLHHFGSRSEQRLSIFWLKFNEIKYYLEKFNKKPIILLDDIFSELDLKNKKLILRLIKNYQTIVTSAEPESLSLSKDSKSIIKL